ncbi:MAG: RNA-directed DNA polymerase [Pseudomonadota bacterium]|nr:RNA-directed DNA polymerase [Pseudomonadota bacterium]
MALEEKSVRRAIKHLVTLGDTDIFPIPFEFSFYRECENDIVQRLTTLQAGSHTPTSAFECLSPKGNLSFRIAHQLFPVDTLLYTAAVIQIAPLLEALKLPSENGPFAYRFIDDDDEPRLFARSSNFHDWLLHLKGVFLPEDAFSDAKYVLETDISDFYARIYFHRLEHVLDDCEAPNQVRKIIEKIIKETRARQSHGLPVGTSASRILAEALLVDTDQMLEMRSVAYSRYVDDFRIVVDHQGEVHSILCNLAEHLMLTEGLSLNANKTRTYTSNEAVDFIDAKLTDVFSDEELQRLNLYIAAVYDDEDISVEDVDDVDPENLISKLRDALDPKKVDYTAIKVILKVLRAVEIENPIGFIDQFIELVYHTPRDFCLLVGGLAQRHADLRDQIANKLVSTIQTAPFKDMSLSRIWVGHLFVTQALPITEASRVALNLTRTEIEQRQDLLLRGLLNERPFFRAQKTKFDAASEWAKPALMLGAACLSTSEYTTWLETIKAHHSDPTSDIFRKWLKENQADVWNALKYDYIIKTRAEKIAELFGEVEPGSILDTVLGPSVNPSGNPENPFG